MRMAERAFRWHAELLIRLPDRPLDKFSTELLPILTTEHLAEGSMSGLSSCTSGSLMSSLASYQNAPSTEPGNEGIKYGIL